MRLIHSIDDIRREVAEHRAAGKSIGLVPTMGALHAGHRSLVERARRETDFVIMTVFVNPAQFGPGEDFAQYPRTLADDCRMAGEAGCDLVFAPPAEALYPKPYYTYVTVDDLGAKLCGRSRAGHFRGVATIVLKLFNITTPHVAFFGAKDAQQVIVLKRMALDLNVPVKIEVCPTVREADGLAMSSRNRYLTPAERAAAPAINAGLQAAARLFSAGGPGSRSTAALLEVIDSTFAKEPLLYKEYIEIVSTTTLEPLTAIAESALVAVACRTGESKTRLIDNIVLGGLL